MFFDKMVDVLKNELNVSTTENRALGYGTTGKYLLDLNFAVASLRKKDEMAIVNMFSKVFYEDRLLAMKWLFYSRDIREGLGERRLFRVVIQYLANNHEEYIKPLIPIIGEYGRFDDLLVFIDTPLKKDTIFYFENQLNEDIKNKNNGEEISLLAKWLPSVTTSSKETVRLGRIIAKELGLTEKKYRKTLSDLRKYLDVIEVKISNNQWSEIEYSTVPSRANMIYNKAFFRNDQERRTDFLEQLKNNKTKINAGTLFPHEIVNKYVTTNGQAHAYYAPKSMIYNETLEQLWKHLPEITGDKSNTLVVADGSGSMTVRVDNKSAVTALDVANALAIYFAERAEGPYKNKYITFSGNPQLVNLDKGNNLKEKIEIALRHSEVSNTDITKVFELILVTAVKNKLSQHEIPKNLLIISDMEFDQATSGFKNIDKKLFKTIAKKYKISGYKLPRLVFWNVNSRSMTIPVIENDLGIGLVSGFSINILKMVISNELDPFKLLLNQLNSKRYEPIENLLKHI